MGFEAIDETSIFSVPPPPPPFRPYLIGLETRWRPGGDLSFRWLRRCLREVSWRLAGSPGSRGKFKHVRFFGDFFQSPAGLGDVSISCGDVAETNFVRDWGDVSTRLRIRCGDCRRRHGDIPWLPGELVVTSLRHRPGESGSHFLVSRVAATSPWWERKPIFCLPSRPSCRDWSVTAVSPWWERKPFLGLPSHPSCRDVSASEIGPLLSHGPNWATPWTVMDNLYSSLKS